MSEKSHVSMVQHQCLVCLTTFNTGELLLHQRLSPVLDRHTVVGHSLCPDCKKLHEDGFIAFVGVRNSSQHERLTQKEAQRSGDIVHVRRELANDLFNMKFDEQPLSFCDQEVIEYLAALSKQLKEQEVS